MGSHSNMDDMSDGDAITGEQGPVDADADEYEYDGGVGGVRTGIRRNRAHKNGLPAPLQAGLQRLGELPGTTVPGFGEGRVFSNSVEFLRAWSAYEAATFTKFTSRGSCLVATHNKNWREKCAKGGVAEDSDECKSGIVPDHMGHAMIVRRCKHGVYVQSRATGVREVQTSQYLACDARLTVTATKDSKGRWMFVTRDEYHHHNHPCDQSMLDANGKSALLAHPKVMEEVERMVQARAPSRNICDMLAANFNIHVTPKELANIKRDRLGGQGAMANLKLLLARFASFPESQCVLLDDQEGQVCGVVMQSASQKKLFQRFGDNIILDWTHNTNNLGFYLGSLMVTSVSGRGVSVYDFLCLEQTETMMTTLFQAFIDGNPGAKDKVKSFVIDKDYREWRVLERMFEKSTVLLCQFHAIKWFAYVVTMRKYNLSVCARERVLKILFSMVYAQTIVDFEMHESDLEELLADESPQFIKYMQSRWYNCRKMWSDCERSLCFTALNTTSNRIESSWNQIKIILGKKLRVDLCIESIFAYMTAVLKREYRVINKYARRLVLRSSVHEYMRSTCAEISEYA